MQNILDLDQPQEVIQTLSEFARSPKGFIVLAGKNGTGKTFAALQVYNYVTPYRLPAYDKELAIFINQAGLNIKLNECEYKNSLLGDLIKTKLLVLDDLGTRQPTETFNDFLYALIDQRYNLRDNRGTIITTNLNASAMRVFFGDAITSRVASGTCFRFDGEDRRFQNPKF